MHVVFSSYRIPPKDCGPLNLLTFVVVDTRPQDFFEHFIPSIPAAPLFLLPPDDLESLFSDAEFSGSSGTCIPLILNSLLARLKSFIVHLASRSEFRNNNSSTLKTWLRFSRISPEELGRSSTTGGRPTLPNLFGYEGHSGSFSRWSSWRPRI